MTRAEAARQLTDLGLRKGSTRRNSEYVREYWVRTDGQLDTFLDHSATITVVGKEAVVSNFLR